MRFRPRPASYPAQKAYSTAELQSPLLNEREEEPAYKEMELEGKKEKKGMTLSYQWKPTKT